MCVRRVAWASQSRIIRVLALGGFQLHTPLSTKASLDQPFRGGTDIADERILDQRLEGNDYLGALVWHGAELGFSKERVEDP